MNLLKVLDAYPFPAYLGRDEHFDVPALRVSFAVHEFHDIGKVRLRVCNEYHVSQDVRGCNRFSHFASFRGPRRVSLETLSFETRSQHVQSTVLDLLSVHEAVARIVLAQVHYFRETCKKTF